MCSVSPYVLNVSRLDANAIDVHFLGTQDARGRPFGRELDRHLVPPINLERRGYHVRLLAVASECFSSSIKHNEECNNITFLMAFD